MKTFDPPKSISNLVEDFDFKKNYIEEVGTVKKIQDGVVILDGLDKVAFGDIISFESGVYGYVIDLDKSAVGVIVLGDYLKIKS